MPKTAVPSLLSVLALNSSMKSMFELKTDSLCMYSPLFSRGSRSNCMLSMYSSNAISRLFSVCEMSVAARSKVDESNIIIAIKIPPRIILKQIESVLEYPITFRVAQFSLHSLKDSPDRLNKSNAFNVEVVVVVSTRASVKCGWLTHKILYGHTDTLPSTAAEIRRGADNHYLYLIVEVILLSMYVLLHT